MTSERRVVFFDDPIVQGLLGTVATISMGLGESLYSTLPSLERLRGTYHVGVKVGRVEYLLPENAEWIVIFRPLFRPLKETFAF